MKPQSDQRLAGRVAVVTGVAGERGIGRAISLRYAEEGARLALLGALLFLVFPDKDATMFWPVAIPISLALLMFLSAYRLHLSYVETGRRLSLASAT